MIGIIEAAAAHPFAFSGVAFVALLALGIVCATIDNFVKAAWK